MREKILMFGVAFPSEATKWFDVAPLVLIENSEDKLLLMPHSESLTTELVVVNVPDLIL
jgi:hypothetical protein